METVYTASEAAMYLNRAGLKATESYIYQLRQEGKLVGVEVDHVWHFAESELDRYISDRLRPPMSPERFRQLADSTGLTRRELAARLYRSRATIMSYLSGKRRIPDEVAQAIEMMTTEMETTCE